MYAIEITMWGVLMLPPQFSNMALMFILINVDQESYINKLYWVGPVSITKYGWGTV